MKRIIVVFVSATILLSLAFLFSKNRVDGNLQKSEVHYHAGFQVYKNNEQQDYSAFEYMNFISCGEHDHEDLTPEEEQMEKAHLHDFVDDVVHVHRDGALWGDLFRNINVEINPTEVYINGEKFEGDFLSHDIKPYDSVVIFEGEIENLEEKLANAVTKDHIVEVEGRSEYCGS